MKFEETFLWIKPGDWYSDCLLHDKLVQVIISGLRTGNNTLNANMHHQFHVIMRPRRSNYRASCSKMLIFQRNGDKKPYAKVKSPTTEEAVWQFRRSITNSQLRRWGRTAYVSNVNLLKSTFLRKKEYMNSPSGFQV